MLILSFRRNRLHWSSQSSTLRNWNAHAQQWEACPLRETALHEREASQEASGFRGAEETVPHGGCLVPILPQLPVRSEAD